MCPQETSSHEEGAEERKQVLSADRQHDWLMPSQFLLHRTTKVAPQHHMHKPQICRFFFFSFGFGAIRN